MSRAHARSDPRHTATRHIRCARSAFFALITPLLTVLAGTAVSPSAAGQSADFGPPDAAVSLHAPAPFPQSPASHAPTSPPASASASSSASTTPHSTESLPLGSISAAARAQVGRNDSPARPARGLPLLNLQTLAALALVVALAVGVKIALTRSLRRAGALAAHLGPAGRAPSGVLTVLGRYPVGRRQSLVLLKVDQRALLLAHTEQGFTTLTEFTDPEEVASLLVATRDEEGASLSSRFNQMLHELERDPSVSDAPLRETPLASRNAVEPTSADQAIDRDPATSLQQRLQNVRGRTA